MTDHPHDTTTETEAAMLDRDHRPELDDPSRRAKYALAIATVVALAGTFIVGATTDRTEPTTDQLTATCQRLTTEADLANGFLAAHGERATAEVAADYQRLTTWYTTAYKLLDDLTRALDRLESACLDRISLTDPRYPDMAAALRAVIAARDSMYRDLTDICRTLAVAHGYDCP